MVRRKINWAGWAISLWLHLVLIGIVSLLLDKEEVDEPALERAGLQCALVEPLPFIKSQPLRSKFGRWPMDCDHRTLIEAVRGSEVGIEDQMRCEGCGWPWWVIRTTAWDDCSPGKR